MVSLNTQGKKKVDLDCYICGGKLWRYDEWIDYNRDKVPGQKKMQCEHILPIITAISKLVAS